MRCFRFDSLRATSIFRSTTISCPSFRQVAKLRSFGHSQLRHSHSHSSRKRDADGTNLRLLNKSLFDASLKCHRLGWYARRNRLPSDRNRNDLSKNPMKDFLIRQGIWFERYVYAHKYGYGHDHPSQYCSSNNDDECNGEISSQQQQQQNPQQPRNLAIVNEGSPTEAAKATNILMAQGLQSDGGGNSIDIILQPTFLCGNLVARADVAVRSMAKEDYDDGDDDGDDDGNGDNDGDNSWEILEIKSSTEKSFRKKIPDLAFTVCVARAAGYRVSRASLVVVDPTYVRKNDIRTADAYASNDADDDAACDDDDDENLLYKTIDCTELVDSYILKNKMDKRVTSIDAITGGDGGDNKRSVPPPVKYKLTCGKCELLGVECGSLSSIDKNSNKDNDNNDNDDEDDDDGRRSTTFLPLKHGIWELPRLTQKHFPDVLERALPTLEIQDMDLMLPDESSFLPLLTKNQMRFFHAVVSNAVVVEYSELEKRLESIANNNNNNNGDGGPVAMYLDFEAVSILNPPHPGMAPYETIVTQYSLHRHEFNNGDNGLSHSEYLSDPQRDCRKELLEHLLDDLGYYGSRSADKNDCGGSVSGPILVYSSYEKTQLKKLANLFPEHSDAISDVIEHRLVDLEKIIKDCVSHPGFCGRSSIKKTLPALVPGFEKAYQDLLENTTTDGGDEQHGIAEGGAASAAFADLMSGVCGEAAEIERKKTALLEYCKLDTLALVEIHKALWKLIDDRRPVSKGKATR